MKWKIGHVPILLMASVLAMIGLVIFQYKWINHSQMLYDEVFHQRACMALCSTLEEYGEGAICSSATYAAGCIPVETADTSINEGPDLVHNEYFHSDLRKTLDFYNIDLTYQMTQSENEPPAVGLATEATCVVNIPSHEDESESYITLDFPDKENFMMGKMKFMIGATLLILIFTGFVLLLANWWLLKQKRLLRTNVEIYNNMAHEFRTPLTNINLAASLMSKEEFNGKNAKFLDIISRENSKLISQVERILHLARLDNGDYALKSEQLHLKSLLHAVKEELEIQIEERKATLQIEEIPEHFEISGDRQHLTNVFRNLIDNALKYAAEHPVITISAKEQQDGIMITVQDNGIGIPPSQNQMIFEKFQRIQQGNLHGQKGFGLGLAYVKRIVELHKGTVQVDSEVNKGSRFNVYLPKFC